MSPVSLDMSRTDTAVAVCRSLELTQARVSVTHVAHCQTRAPPLESASVEKTWRVATVTGAGQAPSSCTSFMRLAACSVTAQG